MPVIDSLLPLGNDPIPGAAPTGESVRYEEVFGRFEAEINKLDNPAGPTIDWKQAAADGRTILAERSKDILVASYLTRALYELHGLEGASAGLTVCRDLLDHFWDGMHPQRVRPRRSALEWISERLSNLLDPLTITSSDHPHLLTAQGVVEDIWTRYNEKFEGEDCGLATLRRRLSEIINASAQADGDAVDTAGATAGASAPARVAGGGSGGGPGGPVGNRTVAIQRLNEVALYFSTYEPHSPVGMLVNRAIHWSQISFEDVFSELLKDRQDAQDHIWNTLGIKKPEATG